VVLQPAERVAKAARLQRKADPDKDGHGEDQDQQDDDHAGRNAARGRAQAARAVDDDHRGQPRADHEGDGERQRGQKVW
jgi:hypothetical protein